MSKISQYESLTTPAAGDMLPIVDIDDTSMSPEGTTKQITIQELATVMGGGQQPYLSPSGITGATAASRYVGATVSGPPVSGTFAVGDWTLDQAEAAIWVCVIAGSAPTAGQFRRMGDHAYQFRVESYGAVGNGVVVADAVMTAGSPNLTCALSTPFTSTPVDGGKAILVSTANGTYAHLAGRINTVSGPGAAVLNANATVNTGGTPGAICYFGTDDTAAIQAAINAATAYAQAHDGYAEVLFGDHIYIVAGPFTAIATGNCQIGLPVISPTASTGQVVLMLRGVEVAAPLEHWNQVFPQAIGTVLASVSTSGTQDTGNGPSSVIGSPVNGYGGEPGLFSNCLIQARGLNFLLPYNATMGGFDAFGMLMADLEVNGMAAALAPTTGPAPSMSNANHMTNQWSFGVRMPVTGNQTESRLGSCSFQGLTYGFMPSEWSTGTEPIRNMYCIGAVAPYAGGTSMVHAAHFAEVSSENCINAIIAVNGPVVRIDIDDLQVEALGGSLIYDPSNWLQGRIGVRDQGAEGAYLPAWLANGGLGLSLYNLMTHPGFVTLSGASAKPASGSAWGNYFLLPAEITLSVSGGTITAVTTAGGTELIPAACTWYRFDVASGESFTAVFTGVSQMTCKLLDGR